MSATSHRPRPAYFRGSPAKYPAIVKTIRARIVSGELPAGARLPTRLELEKQFRTSSTTIQKALTQLATEGFTQVRGRSGTFVATHPPHRNHYALIFFCDPSDLHGGGWSHFFAALSNEATRIQQASRRRFECFYGINGSPDTENYQRLVAKLRAHQFAGLIFTTHPGALRGTPLVELAGLPRVAVMSDTQFARRIPAVYFDPRPWYEKAFAYLAAHGRKRVAFITQASWKLMPGCEYLPELLAARGLTTRPEWRLPLPLWSEGAHHFIQLLMRSAGERPDALVITDDNLAEPVAAGLMAERVRVPQDVEVVTHANFPRSGPRTLPLTWLGYDSHAVLQACLAILDQQGRGKKPPVTTTIAPVFEDELPETQRPLPAAAPQPAELRV